MPSYQAYKISFIKLLIKELNNLKATVQKGQYFKVSSAVDAIVKKLENGEYTLNLVDESDLVEVAPGEYAPLNYSECLCSSVKSEPEYHEKWCPTNYKYK